MLVVGAIDDVFTLPPVVKLCGQVAAAIVAYFGGAAMESIYLPGVGSVLLGWADLPASVIWIVAIINAINLLDGLDGLAAGVSAVIATAMGAVAFELGNPAFAALCVVVAGASSGFLVHNFHPARIFMGDAGSNFLGLCLGCLSLLGNRKGVAAAGLAASFVILGLPMLDMLFSMLRRTMQGRSPFSADRGHLHHMLIATGLSQRRVVLSLYVVSLALAGLGVVGAFAGEPAVGWVLLVLLLAAVLGYRAFGFRLWNDLLRQRAWSRAVVKGSDELKTQPTLARRWKLLTAVLRLMRFGWAELHVFRDDGRTLATFERTLEVNLNGTRAGRPVCLDLGRNGGVHARLYLRDHRSRRATDMMYRVALLRPLLDTFEECLAVTHHGSTPDLQPG
jgi:UDP-N-acetylmuramyl pentapeptide phosphotransferase/UDP-N-acetylglucosamine-1-phosphate transferase